MSLQWVDRQRVSMRVVDAAPSWAEAYERHAARLGKLAMLPVRASDARNLVVDAVQRAVTSAWWKYIDQHGVYLARVSISLAEDRSRSASRRSRRETSSLQEHAQGASSEADVEHRGGGAVSPGGAERQPARRRSFCNTGSAERIRSVSTEAWEPLSF